MTPAKAATPVVDPARRYAASKRGDTRNRMLISAAEVMRERGAAGVTIDAVLARSGAPRGSVYYHFPKGRNQILTEALRYAGDAITATIDDAVERGAMALLRGYVDFWEALLIECDFSAGCPVVAAAIASADEELELSTEAGVILGRWCTALTQAFVADGFTESDAASLAVMSIAALEGATCCAARPAASGRCARSASNSNSSSRQGNSFVETDWHGKHNA